MFILINQLVIANISFFCNYLIYSIHYESTYWQIPIKTKRKEENFFTSRLRSIIICLIGTHRHGVYWHWHEHETDWRKYLSDMIETSLFLLRKKKKHCRWRQQTIFDIVLSIQDATLSCGIMPTQPSALPIPLNVAIDSFCPTVFYIAAAVQIVETWAQFNTCMHT